MKRKKCFKCGEIKDLDLFYVHKQMADGHLNKCVECTKIDMDKSRSKRIEYYRQYDRDRSKLPERYKKKKDREKRFPLIRLAHVAVYSHVSNGKLKKEPCEVCGEKNSVAHHDDYAKPLEVRWLCRSHHRKWHIENTAKNIG